jgi:chemotaxis protein CheX
MRSGVEEIHVADKYTQYLDSAVEEVFHLMMGVSCAPVSHSSDESPETISAVIGFAGSMSGICVLRSGGTVSLLMAERLTNSSLPEIDDTVMDAMGEICNMIAGAWKNQQPRLASTCLLSTPTVVTGRNYHLHMQKPDFRIERSYQFETAVFTLVLACESLE